MEDEATPSRLLTFFAHPAVGIVSTLSSVIGLALAIYFYLAAQEKPGLTIYVHPVRATVVKKAQASALAVSFSGKQVSSDISAAQIAIWNDGKRPIRSTDIRQAVAILAPVPILEATIRKRSRDVVNLDLDRSKLGEGRLVITWDILEQGDGAVMQLIYAGDADAKFGVRGALVGQQRLEELASGQKVRSPQEQYALQQSSRRLLGYMSMGTAALMFLSVVVVRRRFRRQFNRYVWVMVVFCTVYFAYGLWILLYSEPAGPPFGF